MINVGDVLEGCNLENSESVKKALMKVRVPETKDRDDRFDRFVINNQCEGWTVKLCFFQGFDESGNIPNGYLQNTGVTVGGINVTPGSAHTTYLQPTVNCEATRVESSVQWRRNDGYEPSPVNMPDFVAKEGEFFIMVGWDFCVQESLDSPPKVSFRIRKMPKKGKR